MTISFFSKAMPVGVTLFISTRHTFPSVSTQTLNATQKNNFAKAISAYWLRLYQIPSPLEKGKRVAAFHIRLFRLLLRFLKQVREENLIGLTKYEIALYVINMLDEDDNAAFETAISNIKRFRYDYNNIMDKVKKRDFVRKKLTEAARKVNKKPRSLFDYADSNGRYALLTGLLTTRCNKLALSVTSADIRQLLDSILNLQKAHSNGPSWNSAYAVLYEKWLTERSRRSK